MSPYVEYLLVIMIPTVAIYGLIFSFRGWRWAYERWPRSRRPEPEPIERLTGNLRRLRAELESMETRTGVPHKNLRVRALRGAYLNALTTACHRLAVDPPGATGVPGRQQADQAEIYRVESDLRRRGLDVREPATH